MNVELRGEFGDAIEAPLEAFVETNEVPTDSATFPYLSRLDPYGNTTFGRVQMEVVLPELRRLVSGFPADRGDSILRLAERCLDEVHVYLVFVGD